MSAIQQGLAGLEPLYLPASEDDSPEKLALSAAKDRCKVRNPAARRPGAAIAMSDPTEPIPQADYDEAWKELIDRYLPRPGSGF